MKLSRLTTWILLIPLLVCCSVQEPAPLSEGASDSSDKSFTPGLAMVRLSDEAAGAFDPADHTEALEALGVHSMTRVFPEAGEFEARHRAAGLHRWYRVSYDPGVARTKAGDELSALPGVEAVSFLPRKERRSFFNDPFFLSQWNYANDGTLFPSFKAGMDINVLPVWESFTGGSRDVIVAVLDGGIQADHPDLNGVILTAIEGSRDFVEGHAPIDLLVDEHGTHVAGTIAAINNNRIGVAGIAGGLDGHGGVRVMACNIFSDDENEYGDESAALVWAADHGAVIANNSWGFTFDTEKEAESFTRSFLAYDNPLKDAIDYFTEHAGTDARGNQTGPMKGGLVLFSSGNDGYRTDPIGEYGPVFSVGAFGPDGKMPKYSTYGAWVDVLAPGGSNSFQEYEGILSTIPDGKYVFYSGTSMACPHASGVAALLVSYFGGPGFTVDMLREALLAGAVPNVIDLQGRTAGGKLDAFNSFCYLAGSGDPTGDQIEILTTYDGDWRLKSHESLDVPVSIKGNAKAQLPVSFSTDCPGASADCSAVRATLHIHSLQAEPGDYTATIRVGTVAERSFPFTILPNHTPELVLPIADQIVNAKSSAVVVVPLGDSFSDADGEELTYEVSMSGDDVVKADLSGNTLTISPGGYGLASMMVRALDARNTAATASFRVLVRDAYQDMDIFPNPASDWLYVRPASVRTVSVGLVNRAGATVYSAGSVTIGPFDPLAIDLRGLPGGTYSLTVGGQRYTIAKR